MTMSTVEDAAAATQQFNGYVIFHLIVHVCYVVLDMTLSYNENNFSICVCFLHIVRVSLWELNLLCKSL